MREEEGGRRGRRGYGVVLVGVLLVVLGIGVSVFAAREQRQDEERYDDLVRHGVRITGVVEEVGPGSGGGPDRVRVTYFRDGRHRSVTRRHDGHDVGDEVTLYVDRDDSRRVALAGEELDAAWPGLMFGGILLAMAGVPVVLLWVLGNGVVLVARRFGRA